MRAWQLFTAVLFVAANGSVSPQKTAPRTPFDIAAADRIVRAQVDSGFTGVVLIAIGDSVLLRRAYARSASHLEPTNPFWIASITKSFTAAAILTLQKQGRLSVRDSLFRFVPRAPRDKRAITIHQLLTHTAGFDGVSPDPAIVNRSGTVNAILSRPLAYPPGQGYRYVDADYQLLAAVVDVVSGRSWEEYLQQTVLDPIGLRRIGFWCDSQGAIGHPDASARKSIHGRCQKRAGDPADWEHRGANGMWATAGDLLRWSLALRRRQDLSAIESPQVFVRREPPFDVSYGYGARVYTLRGKIAEIFHSGSGDDGHTVVVRELPTGLTVIVLSSAGQHNGTTWSSYIASRLVSRDQ